MRIHPDSFAFTLLLGLLSALPTFGIDMILPTLSATGSALGAPPSDVGLAMSVYLLGLGGALLVYGPVSDRFGRKPIVMFGCALVIAASIGCFFAHSLPQLLIFRAFQGAGASGPGMAAVTIVRDLFEGAVARAKMSYVVFAVNIVPMVAPTVGAALLALGGWRVIYLVPIGACFVLLLAMRSFEESATINPATRLRPAAIARNYFRVVLHPVCLGNILCNAAAAGAVFAYITGSSLFFINALGLSPSQYGVIFGASALSVMGGTFVNKRLGAWGVSPGQMITIGLSLSSVLAVFLLVMVIAGGKSIMLVVLVMVGVALSFGLISPNAMNGAMQPLPEITGSASAVLVFVQMVAAASSSGLVAGLFDEHSAYSMAVVMVFFCALAIASYVCVVRPAERFALLT
ncbi:MAG: transporter, family, multidrug resistance protein [Acetobacteraceae bacterium]|nr:transporter, family, multidrug resistance protein [Acetobacteraceae bacterium]